MTYKEYNIWMLYFEKYGPLNPQRKYDRPSAIVAWMLSKVNGGKADLESFMPVYKKKEKEVSVQEFTSMLLEKGFKLGKRR